jgi:hypothetical protein
VLRQHHLDTGILDNLDGVISTPTGSDNAFLSARLEAGLPSVFSRRRPVKQFAFIRSALREQPYRVEIGYDPDLGCPRRVYIDPRQYTADEEYGFAIEAFTALSR